MIPGKVEQVILFLSASSLEEMEGVFPFNSTILFLSLAHCDLQRPLPSPAARHGHTSHLPRRPPAARPSPALRGTQHPRPKGWPCSGGDHALAPAETFTPPSQGPSNSLSGACGNIRGLWPSPSTFLPKLPPFLTPLNSFGEQISAPWDQHFHLQALLSPLDEPRNGWEETTPTIVGSPAAAPASSCSPGETQSCGWGTFRTPNPTKPWLRTACLCPNPARADGLAARSGHTAAEPLAQQRAPWSPAFHQPLRFAPSLGSRYWNDLSGGGWGTMELAGLTDCWFHGQGHFHRPASGSDRSNPVPHPLLGLAFPLPRWHSNSR